MNSFAVMDRQLIPAPATIFTVTVPYCDPLLRSARSLLLRISAILFACREDAYPVSHLGGGNICRWPVLRGPRFGQLYLLFARAPAERITSNTSFYSAALRSWRLAVFATSVNPSTRKSAAKES